MGLECCFQLALVYRNCLSYTVRCFADTQVQAGRNTYGPVRLKWRKGFVHANSVSALGLDERDKTKKSYNVGPCGTAIPVGLTDGDEIDAHDFQMD